MTVTIHKGDCREVLRNLPAESVHCVVTSPPYFGLRDYGTAKWEGGDSSCNHRPPDDAGVTDKPTNGQREHAGRFAGDCWRCGAKRIDSQIGLEPTPDAFVSALVGVFADVRRVLRKDGTVWLNLGDSYAGSGVGGGGNRKGNEHGQHDAMVSIGRWQSGDGIKPKDLIGVPWRVAFALQADGWYLRQDIIWSKPNPMPESVRDRCTKAHEYIFLLSKAERYYFDQDAIRESHTKDWDPEKRGNYPPSTASHYDLATNTRHKLSYQGLTQNEAGRNKRSVWEVVTQGFPEAHFATFPPALIEPCILAGCPEKVCTKCGVPWLQVASCSCGIHRTGLEFDFWTTEVVGRGTVLDPFFGAGTTGLVADRLGRDCIGIELNPSYAAMAERRIKDDAPLFAEVR
jgi:DNA modification methylase